MYNRSEPTSSAEKMAKAKSDNACFRANLMEIKNNTPKTLKMIAFQVVVEQTQKAAHDDDASNMV